MLLNKVERIKELTVLLNQYRDLYYNHSQSEISDFEYDNLFDELTKLEEETGIIMANSPTQTVGYEVKSKLEKVTHTHPMLSLDKTKSVDKLIEFAEDKDCILSLKMDGLTVLLTYENGNLIQAETRGNGEVGEIITHNARVFKNIPLHINYLGHFEIEGEAIITNDDFKKINAELLEDKSYKNPRNLVSGSVRQLDSSVAAQRHIRFIAWKVPYIEDEINSDNSMLRRFIFSKELGFEIVPFLTYANNTSDKDNIQLMIDLLKNESEKLSYPIDGLVMTYNDIQYGQSLGMTGHHPRHSIAFKFYEDEEETTITGIDWTMGKTGVLTPTAVFETVELAGTDVSRASLHNVSILKELQIGIGDIVTVYKANEIIPQIRENLTRSNNIVIPDICPICGGKTEIVKDNGSEVLECTNPDCTGKLLGKLTHFCSKNAMNIEGMSDSTLEFLLKKGWITCFADIYTLDSYWDEWIKCNGFGEKSVLNLLENIANSKNTTLQRFLYAHSIPLIGKTASKDISKHCYDNIQAFIGLMNENYDFTCINGFGNEMQKSLSNWWKNNKDEFISLAEEMILDSYTKNLNTTQNILQNQNYVITGKLEYFPNRNALVEKIESLGGKVSSSVTSKTNALINNDVNSVSGKNKKAKQLNIPIISERDFLKMIGE